MLNDKYDPEITKNRCIKQLELLIKSIKEDEEYYDYSFVWKIKEVKTDGIIKETCEENILQRTLINYE